MSPSRIGTCFLAFVPALLCGQSAAISGTLQYPDASTASGRLTVQIVRPVNYTCGPSQAVSTLPVYAKVTGGTMTSFSLLWSSCLTYGLTGTPFAQGGTGAGTGATVTVTPDSGYPGSGTLSVTAGTSAAAQSVIARVYFMLRPPARCFIAPLNAAASVLGASLAVSGSQSGTVTAGSTAAISGTLYTWSWECGTVYSAQFTDSTGANLVNTQWYVTRHSTLDVSVLDVSLLPD